MPPVITYLDDDVPRLPVVPKSNNVRIFVSFVVDYVILFVLFGAVVALNYAVPFHQHFALENYTLHYPYAEQERVPEALLYICSFAIPAVVIALYTLVLDALLERRRARREQRDRRPYSSGIWELNAGILGLLLANTIAYVITGILKNFVGKPRPDLIARCQPDIPDNDFYSPVYGLSNITICTQADSHILEDGFRSFPSGHSSSSFAGLFYLTLYLAGKIAFFDHQGHVWKTVIVLAPSVGAALIAASRIMDARHHPFDVIAGSFLGVASAFIAYQQYFPSVTSTNRLGRAHSARRKFGLHEPKSLESIRLNRLKRRASLQVQPAQSVEPGQTPQTQAAPDGYSRIDNAILSPPVRQRTLSTHRRRRDSLDFSKRHTGAPTSEQASALGFNRQEGTRDRSQTRYRARAPTPTLPQSPPLPPTIRQIPSTSMCKPSPPLPSPSTSRSVYSPDPCVAYNAPVTPRVVPTAAALIAASKTPGSSAPPPLPPRASQAQPRHAHTRSTPNIPSSALSRGDYSLVSNQNPVPSIPQILPTKPLATTLGLEAIRRAEFPGAPRRDGVVVEHPVGPVELWEKSPKEDGEGPREEGEQRRLRRRYSFELGDDAL